MDADMKVGKGKRKRKIVKKKGGIIKKQDVKLQSKNLEKVTGNLNTNVGKILNKKPDSKMTTKKDSEGGKKDSEGEEQTNTDSEENTDTQDPPKPKRPKRRNRELNVPSGKMELTPLLTQETDGRTSHRDERTLYVRFPPALCSVRDKAYLETLVPSAVDIRLPRLSPGNYAKFCYIEFDTEEETTRMRETLATIKINDEAFFADYVGKKSKTQSDKEPRTVDPLRLYVGGLPKGIKGEDIRAAFPTAGRMMYRKANNKFSVSHAFLVYEKREEALRVFNASKNLKILGKEVIVMFATNRNNAKTTEEGESGAPTAKAQKTEDVRMEEGNND